MKRFILAINLIFYFVLFGLINASAQRPIDRIEGSPYMASRKPDTLYVIDETKLSPYEQLTLQSLQGLLSIYKPKIYRINDEGSLMWMSELHSRFRVHLNDTYVNDFQGLVKYFQDSLDGYILCSTTSASINAAISLSSVFNAIVVTDSLQNEFPYLSKVLDVRSWTEEDVYAKYLDSMNRDVLVYQNQDKAVAAENDYSIYSNAFQFYEPLNSIFTQAVFKDMKPNSILMTQDGSEHGLLTAASKNSIMVYPAEFADNLSVLTNINATYNQQESAGAPDTMNPGVHTVCFLMSGGEDIQWFMHSFATSKKWYNADERGTIPLGWTISPALSELAPPIMKYLYDNATNTDQGRDYFVAAPSGLGYMLPDAVPQLNNILDLTNKYLKKSDLRIVNIIGNQHNPDLTPYAECSNLDAIFYYVYSDYAAWKGKMVWIADKPAIGAKYVLGDKETPQSLADKLNNEVQNQFQPEGYSLISVDAKAHSVEDVKNCIGLLGSNVRVVAPDDFVKLIKRNLGVFLYPNYPNPFTDHTIISFQVMYAQNVTVRIVDGSGSLVKTIFDGVAEPGITKVEFTKDQSMGNGTYACMLITASQTKSIKIEVSGN